MGYLILLLIIIVTYVIVLNRFSIRSIITNAFSLLILMLVFVHFVSPILVHYYNLDRRFPNLDFSDYNDSYIVLSYITVSFIFLALGYFCKSTGVRKTTILQEIYEFKDKYIFIMLWIYIIGFGMFMYIFFPLFIANTAMFMANRINNFSGFGYLLMAIQLSTPLFIILLYKYLYKKEAKYLLLLFFVAISTIIISIMTGSRAVLFSIVLYFGLFKLLFEQIKINSTLILKIGTVFVAIFAAVAILGNIRTNVVKEIDTHFEESTIELMLGEMTKSFSHTELLFFLTTQNTNYQLGRTYTAAIALPIPRSLWINKPVGGGPVLTNIVAPGAYCLVNNEFNSSFTTGVFLEAYLNFGFFGAVIVPFLFGLFFATLLRISNKKISIYKRFAIWFLIVMMITGFTTGEFLGVFTRLFTLVFPFLFFDFLNKLRIKI